MPCLASFYFRMVWRSGTRISGRNDGIRRVIVILCRLLPSLQLWYDYNRCACTHTCVVIRGFIWLFPSTWCRIVTECTRMYKTLHKLSVTVYPGQFQFVNYCMHFTLNISLTVLTAVVHRIAAVSWFQCVLGVYNTVGRLVLAQQEVVSISNIQTFSRCLSNCANSNTADFFTRK